MGYCGTPFFYESENQNHEHFLNAVDFVVMLLDRALK